MHIRKHGILALVSAALTVMAVLASNWEGNAMMGSYGDFPASGYYAACNSFPRNSSVEVTNLENGKSLTVLVTRGLESPGIFMMLSVDAANALGISSGKVARIRASEPKSALELSPTGRSRAADPDFNPKLLAQEELKRLGYEIEQSKAVVAEAPKTEAAPAVTEPARTEPTAAAPAKTEPVKVEPAKTEPLKTEPVLVPSVVPPAFVSAAPELINGKKPKPVRTVLLPQLPEPMAPPRTVAVQVAPQPVPTEQPRTLPAVQPEVIARALPLPDETPIQMEPRTSPRRYETPAILPEPSALRRLAPAPESAAPRAALAEPALPGSVRPGVVDYLSPYPLAGGIDTVPLGDPALKDRELPEALALSRSRPGEGALDSSLADPQAKAEERPDTLSMALPPFSRAGEGEYSLADPAIIEQERAQAFARMAPSMLPGGRVPGLAWPELEADEIPDAVLARLVSPPMAVPATSLAEGEVRFEAPDGPVAIAKTTPALDAAETRVVLPEARPVTGETPIASEPGPRAPVESAAVSLSEASEEKPAVHAERPEPAGEKAVSVALGEPSKIEADKQPSAATPTAAPGETIVTLEPSSPKPPALVPSAAAAAAAASAELSRQEPLVTGSLAKGKYYIQIAAFRTQAGVLDAVAALKKSGYLTLVEASSDASGLLWRVFVGPLSRDESGVALVRMRALGYKGAFVKLGT